jgi:hypothetical protein
VIGVPPKHSDADLARLRAEFAADPTRADEMAASAGYCKHYFVRLMHGRVRKEAGGPISPTFTPAISRLERRSIFNDAVECVHLYGCLPTLISANSGKQIKHQDRALRIKTILNRTQKILDNLWAQVEKSDGCWSWKGRWHQAGPKAPRIPKVISIDAKNYVDARRLLAQTRGLFYARAGAKLKLSCGNLSCVNPDHILNLTAGRKRAA